MSEVNHLTEPPLAYLNTEFLKSSEARILRILSEYLDPAGAPQTASCARHDCLFSARRVSVSPEIAALRLESLKPAPRRSRHSDA